MSNSSNLTPSEQPPHRPYLSLLLKIGAAFGVIVALGSMAAAIWGKRVINGRILPLVEAEIEEVLERPIELGDVERLSLSGIQLGETTIPATETDESSVQVDQVSVQVDVRSLLFDKTLKPHIVLVRPDLSLVQDNDGQWLELSLPDAADEEPAITTELQTIEIQDARVSISTSIQDSLVPREPIEVTGADVTATFSGEDSQQVYFELTGDVDGGGFDIKGEGDLENQAVKANVRTQDLPTQGVNILLPSIIGLDAGTLNTNLTVAAALNEDGALDEDSVDVQGTAQFRDGQVQIQDVPQPVRNIRSQLRFKGQRVTLENTNLQLGEVTLAAAGTVDWKEGYDLKAQIPAVSLADVQTLASLDLPENLPVDPASPFELTTQVTGELDSPKARGRLANVDPIQVDKLSLATVWADFVLPLEKFRLKQFELTELRVVPDAGGLVLAQGQADLSDLETLEFELTGQADLPVDAFTQLYGVALPADMVLGSLSAELEAAGNLDNQTAVAQWQLSDSSFPSQGTLTLADQVVTAENTQLQVFGGTVAAQAVAQLDNGDWQATVLTDQVPIEQFTPQAQGLLRAELDAAGNLNDLDLAKIQAGGRAAIANAQVLIPNTNQPVLAPGDWTTDFRWQGDRVVVDSFNAPGLQADGTIGVDFNQPIPIGELDLNVVLEQYDLGPLNTLTPQTVNDYGQLAGLTSFNGRLTGTIDNPSLAGNARLDELALNGFVFESLSGPMTFSLTDGGALDLTGGQDRIQLALDSRFWPTVFEVRNQKFVAQGYGEGRQLHADITQLPLDKLNVRPVAGFGTVAGVLDATIDANLADFANPMAMGEITLENPSLAPIDAQQFAARFRYGNNTATIDQGELLLGDSRYSLTGRASLVPQLQYNGNVTIEEGRIEDLVALVEKLDLSTLGLEDFATPEGTAADLAVPPIALPAGTLLEQIVALEDFLASLPDVTEANNGGFFVPDLTDLSGGFSGTIGFEGDSLALSDASVEFNLEGDSWEWGPYAPPNEFLVQGNIQTLQLEIQPSFITAGDTRIDLSGSGDLDQLTGQLQVTNLPVELAQSIYPLPVAVAGDLGLVTNFSGSLADPIVQGRAVIIDPQINNYPLEEIGANFTYRNATLDLASEVAIEPDDDPITLTGQATYALPFMAQQPSNRLALKAVVPDDSFDLINTLSQDQVRWEQGQGNIVVQVDGTLERPIISGNVRLRDGIIGSDLLETPITNLNGDIEFDLAQLTIPNLQANLGDGQLQVTGQLPIWPFGFPLAAQPVSSNKNRRAKQTEQQTTAPNRLVISLDQLPIDYSGILQAMFDGKVYVDGSVLLPVIGGDLEISRGRVQALDLLSFVGAIELPTESTVDQADLYQADFFGEEEQEEQEAEKKAVGFVDFITLKDFSIVLTDRLSVAGRFLGQPLFDVRAAGKMAVNGPLKNLQPEGEFELQSGWINLFSNQFRLDANQPNTAKFAGELDPVVDVVMKTRVRETDVTRVPAAADGIVGAEVDDTTTVDSVGDVQFINVEAVAKGKASQLTKNLKLTSNPSYSQDTLLVLLGSNVVGGLASGNLTQFAEFLGAGSLANVGNNIANTLGLQSFSVFPTTDSSSESAAGIGIGVEASFALGNRINISILEILNSGNPPRFGLQYRLSEELKLEGASNLDNTELKLEYEIEF